MSADVLRFKEFKTKAADLPILCKHRKLQNRRSDFQFGKFYAQCIMEHRGETLTQCLVLAYKVFRL